MLGALAFLFVMSLKLQNYLRRYRKRYGLSQKELAFLLGIKSSENVCRYEQFQQIPTLQTALALQAVLGIPVAELFAGLYEQAEKEAAKKAKILIKKRPHDQTNQASIRKADLLRAIAITPDINKENP